MSNNDMRKALEAAKKIMGTNPAGYTDESRLVAEQLLALSAQASAEPVAYLDIGAGGYIDIGSDLSDDVLMKLPKGRHMLTIVGTYGIDGYVPVEPPRAAGPVVAEGYVPMPVVPTPQGLDAIGIDCEDRDRCEYIVGTKGCAACDRWRRVRYDTLLATSAPSEPKRVELPQKATEEMCSAAEAECFCSYEGGMTAHTASQVWDTMVAAHDKANGRGGV